MSSAWDRIFADPHLAPARRKLSADEIMTIIRHVWAAEEPTPIKISVNGLERVWTGQTISHEQICELAGEPEHASVTYSYRLRGHEGRLGGVTFKGKSVSVFPDMTFDCVVTGNA